MKKFFISLLLFIFSSILIYGDNTTPHISLNGIPYKEIYSPIIKEDMLFISKEDLSSLTYATIEKTDTDAYSFHFGKKQFTLSPLMTKVRIGNENFSLKQPLVFQDEVLYIPIEVLDLVGIPYTFEENTLSISDLVPYSQNTDRVEKHIFKETPIHLEALPSQIGIFSTEDFIQKEILNAKETNAYISFLDSSLQKEAHNYFTHRLTQSPYNNIKVVLRTAHLFEEPSLSSLEVLPMEIKVYTQRFDVKIGDTLIPVHSLWNTFYPQKSMDTVDVNKTIDVTLMRILYEYYRNAYDLKDDRFFSPFTTVTSSRTNTFSHDVYTTFNGIDTEYTLKIHRIHPTGSLIFLVDLYKKD